MMARVTLGEQAYIALKEKVGQLESGTHLSVRSFAAEIGMGYTPVREAFLRLEREGTLRQIPNVGFFVQAYDITALIHYYQVRECLEPFVLRNAFAQLTKQDMAQMQQYLDLGAKAIRKNDYMSFIEQDTAFHEVFFARYGNPHLTTLYHTIREQNMFCSKENQDVSSYATEDHTLLLETIRAGECEKAVALLTEHIAHARTRMLEGYVKYLK